MGLIPEQEHLTVTDPRFEEQRLKTWPGMAHFAGSGPAQKTCCECALWDNCGADPGYYSKTGKHRGGLKPRSCRKYKELMAGTIGPPVPHNASACQHFALNTSPPPFADKW